MKNLDALPGAARQILLELKRQRLLTARQLSLALGTTGEAVRQQLAKLENGGLVARRQAPAEGPGRPSLAYELTAEGDALFPKAYDLLSVELIDSLVNTLGNEALHQVLTAITDRKVSIWMPLVKGLAPRKRAELLRDLYLKDDPFMQVQTVPDGILIIEKNCPYLEVAQKRPALCSTTVSALTRLFGARVSREDTFQAGKGRCVFRVHLDEPVDAEQFRFQLEAIPPQTQGVTS